MKKMLAKHDLRQDIRHYSSLWNMILVTWAVVMFAVSITNLEDVFKRITQENYIKPILFLLLLFMAIYGIIIWNIKDKFSDRVIAVILVLVAFMIRLAFVPFSIFEPISDFTNYFQAGCDVATNGLSSVLSLAIEYGIWQFAGLSLLMGVQAILFGSTLLSFQVSNCFITAIICGEIFWIGRKLSRKVGIIGAIFYTFYPASIISSQITTNQHGAAMMTMASLYCFIVLTEEDLTSKKRILYSILCSIFAFLADLYHPSAAILVFAYVVYSFFYILRNRKNKTRKVALLKRVGVVIIGYLLLSICVCSVVTQVDTEKTIFSKNWVAGKLYVGSNMETNGGFSSEDYKKIAEQSEDEQLMVALKLIAARFDSPAQAFEHYGRKVSRYMLDADNLFYFYYGKYYSNAQEALDEAEGLYQNGEISEYEYNLQSEVYTEQIDGVKTWLMRTTAGVDQRFLWALWMLCAFGVFRIVKQRQFHVFPILVVFSIGWMSWTMLTELQTRYRYLSIPVVCLIASYGFDGVASAIKRSWNNLLSKEKG